MSLTRLRCVVLWHKGKSKFYSLLGPNVLLSTLFSNTLNLCSSFSVKDQVSNPYKTTRKIMILYILLIFTFSGIRAVIAQSVQRLGYGLDDRGSRFRFPAGAGNFSLHHRVQNGSGAHPAYPMGTKGSFPEGKAAGA
jgi:hypothetical protein